MEDGTTNLCTGEKAPKLGCVTFPRFMPLQNAGLVSKVVVVGLSGVDSQYLQDNMSQLPFMQACSKALPITYFKGQGVRKAIYPLLFYKPEKGAKARKEEDADSEGEEQEGEVSRCARLHEFPWRGTFDFWPLCVLLLTLACPFFFFSGQRGGGGGGRRRGRGLGQ